MNETWIHIFPYEMFVTRSSYWKGKKLSPVYMRWRQYFCLVCVFNVSIFPCKTQKWCWLTSNLIWRLKVVFCDLDIFNSGRCYGKKVHNSQKINTYRTFRQLQSFRFPQDGKILVTNQTRNTSTSRKMLIFTLLYKLPLVDMPKRYCLCTTEMQ